MSRGGSLFFDCCEHVGVRFALAIPADVGPFDRNVVLAMRTRNIKMPLVPHFKSALDIRRTFNGWRADFHQ